MSKLIPIDFSAPAPFVARQLLGYELIYGYPDSGQKTAGIIVETEAYDSHDPASQSFRGPTARNQAMFGPPGHRYIYKIYGLHHCLNLVTGDHDGQAVLIRARAPTAGLEHMRQRRGPVADSQLCNGPAKLFQALGLSPQLNGQPLDKAGIALRAPHQRPRVTVSPRIGINKGIDTPWRFTCARPSAKSSSLMN